MQSRRLVPFLAPLLGLFLAGCPGDPAPTVVAEEPAPPGPVPASGFAVFVGDPEVTGRDELWRAALDGSEVARLSHPLSSAEDVGHHALSPDREHVIYLAGPDAAGLWDVYLTKTADGDTRQLPLTSTAGNAVTSFCWAPDSSRVAISLRENASSQRHVYTVKPDGLGLVRVTVSLFSAGCLEWSQDGQWLVLCGEETEDADEKVFVAASDGTFFLDVTGSIPDGTDLEGARFSPDGSRVAFPLQFEGQGNDPDENYLFTARADGGGSRTKVTPASESEIGDFVWSPDGSAIAYRNRFGGTDEALYVTNPTSASGHLRVSADSHAVGKYAWSPDGTLLAYEAVTMGVARLYVTDTAGNATQVSVDGGARRIQELQWSPDSRRIAYLHDRDVADHADLWLWDSQSSLPPARVTDPTVDPALQVQSTYWSPDGSRLAFGVFSAPFLEMRTVDTSGNVIVIADEVFRTGGFTTCRHFAAAEWSPDGETLVWMANHGDGVRLFAGASDGSTAPVEISGEFTMDMGSVKVFSFAPVRWP